MVQQLFNELHQRVIKCPLVQLTRSATVLINVSLSIARLNISLKVPSATSPISLPPSSRCCIKTTITRASVLIKCEWWMSLQCHLPPKHSKSCLSTNKLGQAFPFPFIASFRMTTCDLMSAMLQVRTNNQRKLTIAKKRGAIQKQICKDVC